jgi:hypothetical protein
MHPEMFFSQLYVSWAITIGTDRYDVEYAKDLNAAKKKALPSAPCPFAGKKPTMLGILIYFGCVNHPW